MKRKIIIFVLTLLIVLTAILSFINDGYRFTVYSAVKAFIPQNIKITSEVEQNNEKYVLIIEDKADYFYDALVEKRLFGLLWKCKRYNPYITFTEEPFITTGLINYGTGIFFIGLKINDDNIKYISIGADSINSNQNQNYTLSLNEVKLHPQIYQYSEIGSNKFLSFSDTNYDPLKFVIRAFDKDGKLYADKFRASKIRRYN